MLYVRSAGSSESTLLHCGKQLQQTLLILVDMFLHLVDMLLHSGRRACISLLVSERINAAQMAGYMHS